MWAGWVGKVWLGQISSARSSDPGDMIPGVPPGLEDLLGSMRLVTWLAGSGCMWWSYELVKMTNPSFP